MTSSRTPVAAPKRPPFPWIRVRPEVDRRSPADDRVVGEELVRPPGERDVVAQVGRRVAEVHGADVVAHGDPLVERGEDAQAQLAREARLPQQDPRERAPTGG
jgi:hypothetical protein